MLRCGWAWSPASELCSLLRTGILLLSTEENFGARNWDRKNSMPVITASLFAWCSLAALGHGKGTSNSSVFTGPLGQDTGNRGDTAGSKHLAAPVTSLQSLSYHQGQLRREEDILGSLLRDD